MDTKNFSQFDEKNKPANGDYVVGYDPNTLSEIKIPVGSLTTKGVDGDSLQVQYSKDNATWHFPYMNGDTYMRQKLGNNEWTSGMFMGIAKHVKYINLMPSWTEKKEFVATWDVSSALLAICDTNSDEFTLRVVGASIGDIFELVLIDPSRVIFPGDFVFNPGWKFPADTQYQYFKFMYLSTKAIVNLVHTIIAKPHP